MDRFKHNSEEGRTAFQAYLRGLLRWNCAKYEKRGGKGAKEITLLKPAQHVPAGGKPLSDAQCNVIFNS